jgi:hypothetical protein
MSGERIDYYPVRIFSPTRTVWEVDYLIREKLPIRGWDRPPASLFGRREIYSKQAKPVGLATLYPPTDYRDVRVRAKVQGKSRGGFVTRKQAVAMIPGYLYVAFTSWDDWVSLLRFEDYTGPLTLVGLREGEPYRLTQDDVRTIQALGARTGEGAGTGIHKSLKVGEDVRVADWYAGHGGMLAGQTRKLTRIDRDKAWVLQQLFDRMLEVPVLIGALEAV